MLNDLFDNVISTDDRNYWFVRTDKGEYYETYFKNNFLAIGWNEITLRDLENMDAYSDFLRSKVQNAPDNDFNNLSDSAIKGKITAILNKNKTFGELEKGDIVIIPSKGSHELAFGIITDEKAYNSTSFGCPYLKRRNVKWVAKENIYKLDAKFGYIRVTKHAISSIDKQYHSVIDNFMFNYYIKDGFSNISLKINKEGDINYFKLNKLVNGLIKVAQEYDKKHNLEVDYSDITVKVNLQSPGFLNLRNLGRGLIYAVAVVSASCSDDNKKNDSNNENDTVVEREVDEKTQAELEGLFKEFEIE